MWRPAAGGSLVFSRRRVAGLQPERPPRPTPLAYSFLPTSLSSFHCPSLSPHTSSLPLLRPHAGYARVWTTSADPYSDDTTNVFTALNEFTCYWNTNMQVGRSTGWVLRYCGVHAGGGGT